MSYRVEIAPGAAREIRRLPSDTVAPLVKVIRDLAADPRPAGAKRIEGLAGCYRVRKGVYRIVYTVEDDLVLVTVVTVGHRKEVYRHLAEKVRQRASKRGPKR